MPLTSARTGWRPTGSRICCSPAARLRARRELRRRGLSVGPAFLHLPSLSATRDLVPLTRAALVEAAPAAGWKRRVSGVAGAVPLLGIASPRVGLVARPAGARPLLAWMDAPDGAGYDTARISSTWRAAASSAIVRPFRSGGPAAVVAKVALAESGASVGEEETRIRRLAPAAESAGARVPGVVGAVDLAGLPALVETRLEGHLAAPLIVDDPARAAEVLDAVCGWLERWAAGTARREPLARDRLERELLAPAAVVAPLIGDGDTYLRALEQRGERAAGTNVPLTAAHNDLTMWNVLVHPDGPGVLDWESAEDAALPLKDLFYAVVDAAAATRGYADRPAAARECLAPAGARSVWVERSRSQLSSRLGIEPDVAELSLHACWLGHAANEHRAAEDDDERPFLEIVRWLASTLGA